MIVSLLHVHLLEEAREESPGAGGSLLNARAVYRVPTASTNMYRDAQGNRLVPEQIPCKFFNSEVRVYIISDSSIIASPALLWLPCQCTSHCRDEWTLPRTLTCSHGAGPTLQTCGLCVFDVSLQIMVYSWGNLSSLE